MTACKHCGRPIRERVIEPRPGSHISRWFPDLGEKADCPARYAEYCEPVDNADSDGDE